MEAGIGGVVPLVPEPVSSSLSLGVNCSRDMALQRAYHGSVGRIAAPRNPVLTKSGLGGGTFLYREVLVDCFHMSSDMDSSSELRSILSSRVTRWSSACTARFVSAPA